VIVQGMEVNVEVKMRELFTWVLPEVGAGGACPSAQVRSGLGQACRVTCTVDICRAIEVDAR
jgi:hypothetical protein